MEVVLARYRAATAFGRAHAIWDDARHGKGTMPRNGRTNNHDRPGGIWTCLLMAPTLRPTMYSEPPSEGKVAGRVPAVDDHAICRELCREPVFLSFCKDVSRQPR